MVTHHKMKTRFTEMTPRRPFKGQRCPLLVSFGVALAAYSLMYAGVAGAADLAPLPLKLPMPAYVGTPSDIPESEHLEKPSDEPRPAFMAPKGVQNVALKKKVTSSDKSPVTGSLELVTDGDKESRDESFLELHRKTQWVQIDLEAPCEIHAVVIWHAHNTPQVYHDVVVQVADGPDFTQDDNVRTLFNNDYDNTSGLGVGKDKEYYENYEGKLIDAKGAKARYVRLYSQGSTFSGLNRYTEVEVWGLAAK
jgi:hypothetical protein